MNSNTLWLIKWWDRLAPIVNGTMKARRDLCLDLAQAMGEEGNDDPSNAAIELAKKWEERIIRGEKPWQDNYEETMD